MKELTASQINEIAREIGILLVNKTNTDLEAKLILWRVQDLLQVTIDEIKDKRIEEENKTKTSKIKISKYKFNRQ